jgi:hypothetical protein
MIDLYHSDMSARRRAGRSIHCHGQTLLLDYLDAVFAQTKGHLSTVTNADLNRVLNVSQYSPLPTLSVRFASVINCNTCHAGKIEYLRGLVKYGGWFPGAEKRSGG